MAYNNPYYYNRSFSVSDDYAYVDATIFSPIYGSSVDFSSRINIISTSDNTLKILPASENNLTVRYKLRFALNDIDAGNLLKTIETAAGTRYLKFTDPSGIYKSMIGYVEDYNVNKNTNANINEITITLSSYTSSPLFNWQTSSIINAKVTNWSTSTVFNKYDILYVAPTFSSTSGRFQNQIYNFNTNSNDSANKDTEIYHVDDSGGDIGGFKYFLPFKISTRTSSVDIPNLNTDWNTASKIYFLKNKNELILSQTDSSTANKKLYINSFNLTTKTFTNLTSFYTQDTYYSFKNANDLYLIKDGEKVTYLSDGLISTSAINSYIYIYKYNFNTKQIEIFCKIDPIKNASFNNKFKGYSNGTELSNAEYASIYNYSMQISKPASSCYANGKLYILVEISFNYVSGAVKNAPFRSSFILSIDTNAQTKIATLSYAHVNAYLFSASTYAAPSNLISTFGVDNETNKIYYNAYNNTIVASVTNAYESQTDLTLSSSALPLQSLYLKNKNTFAITQETVSYKSRFFVVYFSNALTYINETNEIDNFMIAKEDGASFASLSRHFFFDPKLSFDFKNKFDYKQLDYRNSFIQNVKYKENENTLKQFNLKFESVSTAQCRAMLFFLEKKCGYRRFVYDFPIFLKTKKVFICTEWSHSFKYDDCHDLNLLLIEDPNPNVRLPSSGEFQDYVLIRQ